MKSNRDTFIDDMFVVDRDSGCWLWTGAVDGSGYGKWSMPGTKTRSATRLMLGYEGPMCVCHTCDVRRCVNPDHLFLGDHDDNMKDAAAKGKFSGPRPHKQGHNHHNYKHGRRVGANRV